MQGHLPRAEDFLYLTVVVHGMVKVSHEKHDLDIPAGKAHVLMPGQPFSFSMPEESEVLVVMLRKTDLTRLAAKMHATQVLSVLSQNPVLDLNSGISGTLYRYLLWLWEETNTLDLTSSPALLRAVENSVMTKVILAFETGIEGEGTPLVMAPEDSITQAADYISEHFAEPLSLAEIARAVDMLIRSLTRAFRARFGVSPMEMVLERRLQATRWALKTAKPGQTTVKQAATASGFKHVGRFAAAYSKRFGEPPSKTLAR